MTSADFSWQVLLHDNEWYIVFALFINLPGYSHVFSRLFLPCLLLAFRAVGLQFVLQSYPRFTVYPAGQGVSPTRTCARRAHKRTGIRILMPALSCGFSFRLYVIHHFLNSIQIRYQIASMGIQHKFR